MKGNQGLEALAALCGGARKAEEDMTKSNDSNTHQNECSQKNNTMGPPTSAPVSTVSPHLQPYTISYTTNGHSSDCIGNAAQSLTTDARKWQPAVAKSTTYGSLPPNLAALLSASAAGLHSQNNPNAAISNFSGNNEDRGQAAALQQLAYFHLIQSQAAAAAQIVQQHAATQSPCPSSSPIGGAPIGGADANAAIAMVLAAQQQKHQTTSSPAPAVVQDAASYLTQQQHLHQKQHHVQVQPSQQQPASQPQQYHQILPTAAPASDSRPSLGTVKSNMMQPPSPQVPSIASSAHRQNVTTTSTILPPTVLSSGIDQANGPTGPVPIASASPHNGGIGNSVNSRPAPPSKKPIHQPILMRRPSSNASPTSGRNPDEETADPGASLQADDAGEIVIKDDGSSIVLGPEDKKQLKRAANRRSAQESRKRKKKFIEELKEENDELRRKEQILRSIPDLIVVFDSGGKLWFVSHSVNRFLDFTPVELEGTSFWDRLCDESVRLLKAAFMDALAARKKDSDTAPLGSGVWELRLQDKDGSHKLVTLNGVVHFSGDAPECVCSIRPRDDSIQYSQKENRSFAEPMLQQDVKRMKTDVSSSSKSNFPSDLMEQGVKPQQSVVVSSSTSTLASLQGPAAQHELRKSHNTAHSVNKGAGLPVVKRSVGPRGAAQISDAESSSVVSESASDE